MHFKCTSLTNEQYECLEEKEDIPFYCLICRPDWVFTISANNTNPNDSYNFYTDADHNDSSLSSDFSSAHSSDFEFIDTDSDFESRGLNFESLPTKSKQFPGQHQEKKYNY